VLWWLTPVIPELGRQRQEDCKFEVNLGYVLRPYFQIKTKKRRIYLKGNSFFFHFRGKGLMSNKYSKISFQREHL
jgi:lipopolysaccharide assembly outer membrane protein LptD (OstA)